MIETSGAAEFLSVMDSNHDREESELRISSGSVIFVFQKAKDYRQVSVVLGLYHKDSGQGKVYQA